MLCVRKTVKRWAVLIMRTKLFDTDNDFILIAFVIVIINLDTKFDKIDMDQKTLVV